MKFSCSSRTGEAPVRSCAALAAVALLAAAARAQLPDLVVGSVDDTNVTGDWQTLVIGGSVDVTLSNAGPGGTVLPFQLLAFEDRNLNGSFDGADLALGSVSVPAMLSGDLLIVTLPVSGQVRFRQVPIVAFADSTGVIMELNETNNTADAGDDCSFAPQPGPLAATLEWSWTSSTIEPTALNVMMTPAVVDLTGDGVPEVIFGSTASTGGGYVEVGVLRALNGATGAELFTQTDPALRISTTSAIAVGDIDNDNLPEIVACDNSGTRLICFEHDGTFKWRSPALEAIYWGAPSIADLNADGTPEIVQGRQCLDANGALLWTGTAGAGGDSVGRISFASDVDADGQLEVVAGRTVYSATGAIEFNNANLPDGLCAVANFDADAQGEIVVVSGGIVRLYDLGAGGALQQLWMASIPGGGGGGPPTIADYDADGQPEIGVAGASRYAVFEPTGALKWAAVTQDGSSNRTGSSVFDFNGDGSAEVVYRDELHLRIYDGNTGAVLFQVPMSSCTWHEYVLVADVDADGNAEIVAVANNNCGFGPQRGVYVYGATNDDWVPTRRVWNQHAYHITNVDEDGGIPQFEATNWLTPPSAPFNNFRQNAFNPLNPQAAPDLTASFLRATPTTFPQTVTARIGNAGDVLVGAGIPVSFYDGDPAAGGVLLGTAFTSAAIQAGAFDDVTLVLAGAVPPIAWAVADDLGGGVGLENECNETNNTHSAAVVIGLACPADLVEIWGAGPPSQLDPIRTGWATWFDTCDPNAVLSYTDALDPGNAPGEPETICTRTWTLSDSCGNVLQCVQRLTLLSPWGTGGPHFDVRPGFCPNVVYVRAPGATRLSVVGTAEIDVARIDPGSVRISRADGLGGKVAALGLSYADVATPLYGTQPCHILCSDGIGDLVLDMPNVALKRRLALGNVPHGTQLELVVRGRFVDGTPFEARDTLVVSQDSP